MNFDLSRVPFSRFGSYLALSELPKTAARPGGLYLRSVHGDAFRPEVCRLEVLVGGRVRTFKAVGSPAVLRLEAGKGALEICFERPETLRLRGRGGLALRLSFAVANFDTATPECGGRWQVNHYSSRKRYMLSPLAGRLSVDAPWVGTTCSRIVAQFSPGAGGRFAAAIEEFLCSWRALPAEVTACKQAVPPERSFDQAIAGAEKEFSGFLADMPPAPARYMQARQLAAYVNWASVVRPNGHLRRPGMLMSKNWMTSIWSWDHCFNALALADGRPELAWDQFMLMFDHQDGDGALPDAVNDALVVWNFTKPPVHGWTLRQLMDSGAAGAGRLKEVYEPLCAWTGWWFDQRDDDRDGICQYNHGNDSGWDNATAFDAGCPVETPDLSAFLALQMETLSEVARRLGKTRQARQWRRRSQQLVARLVEHFWRGGRFVALASGDHKVVPSESLFLYLPVVLGKRLPEAVLARLLAGLEEPGRFLTAHGLATEPPASRKYQPDGYWRGPVWAPPMLMLVQALADVGRQDLARELSRRFCDTIARSGMAENFDALTGKGLRDQAYTWTASIFLVMAANLNHKGHEEHQDRS